MTQSAQTKPAAPGTVSVVMPAYNAAGYLERSLPPLVDLLVRGDIAELIIVDDGSSDGTALLAERLGARVMDSGGRMGPGSARNLAAAAAAGGILWFVDADVAVHPDAVQHLRQGLSEAGVAAVFGSYDERPPARNFLSQYKNLVHHYYHNRASRDASTFWSGCGAVHTAAFREVGGFTPGMNCVEDIDLGYRLRDAGKGIRLLPEMRCTHLKEWRLFGMLKTEIFCRAIPWSRLILNRPPQQGDLNVSTAEKLRAVWAGLLGIALLLALVGVGPWWVAAVLAVVVGWTNRELFDFFSKRKGPAFAVGATLFHQLYYLYSSASFAWCWLEARVLRC